jgi:hypothetical protein
MLITINIKITKNLITNISENRVQSNFKKLLGTRLHDFHDFPYSTHSYIFLPKKRRA